MKKITTLIITLLLVQCALAQQNYTYWVILKDKNQSAYSINNPSEYLTERAIARRTKQHIGISESDLPVNDTYVTAVKSTGVEVLNKSKWFNAITISTSDKEKIELIKHFPFVKEVIIVASPSSVITPNKFSTETYTPLHASVTEEKMPLSNYYDYGASYNQTHQIGMDCLHNLGYRGEGMVIAYFDAGFFRVDTLPIFDSIRLNNQILGTKDYVNGGTYVYGDAATAHGMCTLSCSAGNVRGQIVGTAPKANFWLFRTENVYSESWQEEINWLAAAEFADSVGVDVINSSLGYALGMTDTLQNHTLAEMDGRTTIVSRAAVWAARKGMLVCTSAGNSGGPPWYKITAPADADSILSVGAIDSLGYLISFSSRGPTADGRIKPNMVARGVAANVANPWGGIMGASGTSFSSPITAGSVACLWQAHPTATNQQVIDAVQQSASQYFTPDTLMGYGIPDFCYAHSLLHVMIGIEHYTDENLEFLYIYPNPFNSCFTINFLSDRKQNVEIELYDIAGRKLFSESKTVYPQSNKFNLTPTTDLAAGIYTLRLITPERSYFKKIVKE